MNGRIESRAPTKEGRGRAERKGGEDDVRCSVEDCGRISLTYECHGNVLVPQRGGGYDAPKMRGEGGERFLLQEVGEREQLLKTNKRCGFSRQERKRRTRRHRFWHQRRW